LQVTGISSEQQRNWSA